MKKFERFLDLTEFMTPVSRDSLDIQELMHIETPELQELWDVMLSIFANQFIVHMTEYGLTQWESMLDITPIGTLDDRRREILKILYGLRPYTLASFQDMLNAVYGDGNVTLNLINNKYELWLNLDASVIYKRNDIYDFSEPIVPKNLNIFFKNEKQVSAGLAVGGYIHITPIIHIGADLGFSIDGLSSCQNVSGYIHVSNNVIHV